MINHNDEVRRYSRRIAGEEPPQHPTTQNSELNELESPPPVDSNLIDLNEPDDM